MKEQQKYQKAKKKVLETPEIRGKKLKAAVKAGTGYKR